MELRAMPDVCPVHGFFTASQDCPQCLINNGRHIKPERYENTYCSQCGCDFGPGNYGYSHCQDHRDSDL